jgi:hypothetical protein
MLRHLKLLSYHACTYAPSVCSAAPLLALHSVCCISKTKQL